MKPTNDNIIMRNKVFLWIGLGTGLILLIPLLAMQLSRQVNWTAGDFIIMGALVFSISSVFVLTARKLHNNSQRVAAAVAFGLVLLYIWAELAVGIFTNLGS